MSDLTRNMLKTFLNKIDTNKMLKTFEHPVIGFNDAFNKVVIPWYLKPFKKRIRQVCIDWVIVHKWSGTGGTISFKRPAPFSKPKMETAKDD